MLAHGRLLLRRRGSSWSWLRTKWSPVREDTTKTSHGRKVQKFFRSTTTMPGTTNWKDDEDDDNDNASSSAPTVFSTIPWLGKGVCVGHYANTTRTYRRQEVTNFARLLHDFNPIHGTNMSNHTTNTTEEELRTVMELQHESYQQAGLVREKEDTPNTTSTPDVPHNRNMNTNTNTNTITITDDDGDTAEEEDTTAIIPSSSSSSLVHGMFVAGIFSSLFAALAPGCIYLNQTLEFVAPVFVNNNNDTNNNNNNDTTGDDRVIGCLQIEKIRPMRRTKGGIVVHCHTRVYKQPQPHGYHRSTTTLKGLDPPQPQSAQLVIHGRATVWLPLGYAGTMTTMTTTRPVGMTPPQ